MVSDENRKLRRSYSMTQKTGISPWLIGGVLLTILAALSVWALSGPPNYEAQLDNKSTTGSATTPNTGPPK